MSVFHDEFDQAPGLCYLNHAAIANMLGACALETCLSQLEDVGRTVVADQLIPLVGPGASISAWMAMPTPTFIEP